MTQETVFPKLDSLAKTILELAGEIERAEVLVKHAVIEAARRNDTHSVEQIVTRWLSEPVTELAGELSQAATSAS